MTASIWNPAGESVIVDPLLRTELASTSGSTKIGTIAKGIGAVGTTLDEVLDREVNIWDYMTPAMRADALSGNPVLSYSTALNKAIQILDYNGTVVLPHKRGKAIYRFDEPILMGVSNAVASRVVVRGDGYVPVRSYLANDSLALFDLKNIPGQFNYQSVQNLRIQCYNGKGSGIKLSGQCFGDCAGTYLEGFTIGALVSNAGANVFSEFFNFNKTEFHLNGVQIQLSRDGGTDASMHGISFNDVTMNVGAGQYGFNIVNVNLYNTTFSLKCFVQAGHAALIRMDCNTDDTGVFGAGFISCEGGPAILTGVGRFQFRGVQNFMSGVTDTLSSPHPVYEDGFSCDNYIKPQAFGATGMQVAPVREKHGYNPGGFNGPYGSFSRLTKANVEALVAVMFAAEAAVPGNMFYTAYMGYQLGYAAAVLGFGLASDGTKIKSYAPAGTVVTFNAGAPLNPYGDDVAWAVKDGKFLIGGAAQELAGSGNPNGSVVGSIGDTYRNRSGGPGSTFYVKESGSNTTAGWVAK